MQALDPDFLRSFLAISETGTYGAAAEAVNKTQSTISAQMKRLEEILGASLFTREGRRNVLTAEGRKLVEYAKAMVRLNDETVRAFRPPACAGTVRFGAIDEYAQAFFPEVLASFRRAYPQVQVDVVTGTSGLLLPALEAGDLDAVIVSCRPGDSSIERLRSDQLHWIGGVRSTVHLDDPLPMAAWSEGCTWRDMAQVSLGRAGRTSHVSFATSNAALLAQAVRNGLGVAVAPRWFISEGLVVLDALDAQCPLGTAEIGIKCRPDVALPALDAFLKYLRDQIDRVAERAA